MKVQVHYIFSRNKKIGSKIIAWGTKHLEPTIVSTPSHVAMLINNKWVIESTLESGVRIISYEKWKSINEEVDKIKCKEKRDMSEIKSYFKQIKDKKYDYFGLTYFSIFVGLNKFFNIKIPQKNKWAKDNMYFCSEVIGKMLGLNYEMIAPVQIIKELKNRKKTNI